MMLSKKEVAELLSEKKYSELIMRSSGKKKIFSILISLSYDKGDVISWRAIEAIGLITGEISGRDPELVRDTAGRLLWMIRDESGGIGWSAPEILGEIVRNNNELCADIAPVIVSFHEEKMLTAGVMRAVGRVGKINTEAVDYAVPIIISYLRDRDRTTRGYAAWAAGELGAAEALNELQELQSDTEVVSFYEDGELKEKSIGEIAVNALMKLNQKKKTVRI